MVEQHKWWKVMKAQWKLLEQFYLNQYLFLIMDFIQLNYMQMLVTQVDEGSNLMLLKANWM